MPKITKRLIDAIDPETKDVIIRDSELKGFICKITPKGRKVYMLYYRTKDYNGPQFSDNKKRKVRYNILQ